MARHTRTPRRTGPGWSCTPPRRRAGSAISRSIRSSMRVTPSRSSTCASRSPSCRHTVDQRRARHHGARCRRSGALRMGRSFPGSTSRTGSCSSARRRRSTISSARWPRLPCRSVSAGGRDQRHHAAHMAKTGARWPADGGALLLGLRPSGLADADLDRAQTAGVQGAAVPRARVPGAPGRAHARAGPGVWLAIHAAEGNRAPRRSVAAGDGRRADRDRRARRPAP